MQYVMALLMTLSVSVGAYESGKDLIDLIVRMAQVATEKLTLNQIGKSIWMENMQKGHKLTYPELPAFLKANITAGGRDVTRDIWGTAYYVENEKWRGLVFKQGGDEFVICSAGPDMKWWDRDDELWYNFDMPDELLFRERPVAGKTAEVDTVLSKLAAFRAKTQEGIAKLGSAIGLTKEITVTAPDPTAATPADTGPK